MTFEEFRVKVVKEAQTRLEDTSVCTDDIEDFYPGDFEGAVQRTINNTIYWNGDYMDEVKPEPNLSDLLDEYCNQEKLWHFEGDSGLEDVNKVFKALGYKGHPFRYGSPLEHFLSDNSDAINALLDWVREQNFPEWRSEVESQLFENEDPD